jgi:Nitroreductase family
MNRRKFVKVIPSLAILGGGVSAYGLNALDLQELKPIVLPRPDNLRSKPLFNSLMDRKTNRNISSKELPVQIMSNLLWSAFGVNRETLGFNKKGRTAPSASNSQEIDLYVVLLEGVYIYEPINHQLLPVAEGDFRSRSVYKGGAFAPVNIFFVVDLSRYDLGPTQPDPNIGDPEVQKSYYYTDTGFIAQNIYLYAASAGLAAWFHNCDRVNTIKDFKLKPTQRVLFAQTVGYPE